MKRPIFLRFVAGAVGLTLIVALAATVPTGERVSARNDARAVADTIRIVVYNIHHGAGLDERLDLERIARLIASHSPDFVALQEIDVGVERTGGVDQAAELGRLTGLTPVFGAFMPYQGGEYGMAVLTRWEVVESRNIRLPDGAEPRTSVVVRARSPESGRRIVFSDVHFYRTEEERMAQAMALAETLDRESDPVIMAGDFNSEPGSSVMDALSATWIVLDKGADHLTFPSDGAEREIDFVLFRQGAPFEVIAHRALDEPVASDHRPLYAELFLPGED